MTSDHRQREIDPRTARAVTLILGLPLRWADSDGGSSEGSVLARGWFQGADECAGPGFSDAPREPRGRGVWGGLADPEERGLDGIAGHASGRER